MFYRRKDKGKDERYKIIPYDRIFDIRKSWYDACNIDGPRLTNIAPELPDLPQTPSDVFFVPGKEPWLRESSDSESRGGLVRKVISAIKILRRLR
ncbi:hypothetical protein HY483_00225 [Candidatus Woesearchaeota archaeon]|nr:hypothetical protein [Candidatus Woesearchaeota archaeon]